MLSIRECVEESLRIEDIHRPATEAELAAHNRFMDLSHVTVGDVEGFVRVYQPDARLRYYPGMDVRVGTHYPPRGGPEIRLLLESVLEQMNDRSLTAWQAHLKYEQLHPFTDGNGRSGRMLWYWMMGTTPRASLGFLHTFYYPTLSTLEPHRMRNPVRVPPPDRNTTVVGENPRDQQWEVGTGKMRYE